MHMLKMSKKFSKTYSLNVFKLNKVSKSSSDLLSFSISQFDATEKSVRFGEAVRISSNSTNRLITSVFTKLAINF